MQQIVAGEVCAVQRQIIFRLADASLSALTGKSVSAGNFGIFVGASTFSSCAGTVGEVGRGLYLYTPTTTEISAVGAGALAGSYISALDIYKEFQVVTSIAVTTNGRLEVVVDALKSNTVSAGAIATSAFAATKFEASIFTPAKFDSTYFAQIGSVVAASILTTPSQKLVTNASGYVGAYIFATSIISATTFSNSAITSAVLDGTVYAAIPDNIIRRNIEGGSFTGRTVGDVFAAGRNRVDITGTGASRTVNVYAADDTSVRWSASVGLSARDAFQTFDPA